MARTGRPRSIPQSSFVMVKRLRREGLGYQGIATYLERHGVSAVIIKDKTRLKRNSMLGTEVPQRLSSIESFSNKIQAGKKAKITASLASQRYYAQGV